MNVPSDQRNIASLAPSLVIASLLLGCSGARLDPEKNQALTFDTSGVSDAGVQPSSIAPMSRKAIPSQLASSSTRQESGAVPTDTTSAAEPIRCTQDPPDPKPTSTRDWIAFEFKSINGAAQLHAAHRLQTPKPRDAARVVGRYAVELWIGCELLERVRFNFPLEGADAPPSKGPRRSLHEQPSFTARAVLSTEVLIPFSERATRAELVDRSAGTRETLAWPPNLSGGVTESTKKKPGEAGP